MNVEFVTSAASLKGRPEEVLPEFAFVGRSNVGKSSLINLFLDRKGMAKTSGKPGKTRLLNYFIVEGEYYLVDLPGYGFAKVSKDQRAGWAKLMRSYLFAGDRPLAVFQLVDLRHTPSADDVKMTNWLREAEVPFAIAPTKIDKVPRSKHLERSLDIAKTLGLGPETPFFPTSAADRSGTADMHTWVRALLEAAEQDD